MQIDVKMPEIYSKKQASLEWNAAKRNGFSWITRKLKVLDLKVVWRWQTLLLLIKLNIGMGNVHHILKLYYEHK